MPTEVIRYLDTAAAAAGDGTTAATSGANRAYNSMASAIADIIADFPNFVTADVVVRLKCAASAGDVDVMPTTATGVNVSGLTTDATRYLLIEANTGHEAVMPWSASRYIMQQNNSFRPCMTWNTRHVELVGIQVDLTGNPANGTKAIGLGPGLANGLFVVRRLLVRGTGTGSPSVTNAVIDRGAGVYTGTTIIAENCVAYGNLRALVRTNDHGSASATILVDNCTCVDGPVPLAMSSGQTGTDVYVRNCVTSGTSNFETPSSPGSYTHGGNVSTDATSPDASGQSKTLTFVDPTNKDYHLSTADASAKGFGIDLSADSAHPFSTDFDNTPRSGTWDSGADETASSAQSQTGAVAIASWTGLVAAITAAVVVTGAVASAAWALPAPSLTRTVTVSATPAVASWTALDAGLTRVVTITGATAQSTWSAPAPAVSTAVTVTGSVGIAAWTAPLAARSASCAVTGSVAIAAWVALAGEAAAGGAVTGQVASATWTSPAPGVTASVTVTGTVAGAAWTLPAAQSSAAVSRTADPAITTWTVPLATAHRASGGAVTSVLTGGGRIRATLSSAPRIGATIHGGSRIVRLGSAT